MKRLLPLLLALVLVITAIVPAYAQGMATLTAVEAAWGTVPRPTTGIPAWTA